MKRQHDVHDSTLSLPREIIQEEILPRLPVKSLLRFKCVSKPWRSLIDSDKFIKNHYQNSRKNQSFPHQRVILDLPDHPYQEQYSLQSLFDESFVEDPSPLDDPIDFKWEGRMRIIGSQNGLLCICKGDSGYLTLYNPSTRVSSTLPNISNCELVNTRNVGLGWIESSNEYKIFAVVSHPDEVDDEQVAKVYSSKTNSWKTLQQWDLPVTYHGPEYIGEKAYWKIYVTEQNVFDIVTFDFKSGVLGMIGVPFPRPRGPSRYHWFWVTDGWFCMLSDCRGKYVQGWIVKEVDGVKESRVKNFSDVIQPLERPFSSPFTVGANGEFF